MKPTYKLLPIPIVLTVLMASPMIGAPLYWTLILFIPWLFFTPLSIGLSINKAWENQDKTDGVYEFVKKVNDTGEYPTLKEIKFLEE